MAPGYGRLEADHDQIWNCDQLPLFLGHIRDVVDGNAVSPNVLGGNAVSSNNVRGNCFALFAAFFPRNEKSIIKMKRLILCIVKCVCFFEFSIFRGTIFLQFAKLSVTRYGFWTAKMA